MCVDEDWPFIECVDEDLPFIECVDEDLPFIECVLMKTCLSLSVC